MLPGKIYQVHPVSGNYKAVTATDGTKSSVYYDNSLKFAYTGQSTI